MTVGELIKLLEGIKETHGEETPVRVTQLDDRGITLQRNISNVVAGNFLGENVAEMFVFGDQYTISTCASAPIRSLKENDYRCEGCGCKLLSEPENVEIRSGNCLCVACAEYDDQESECEGDW